MSGDLSPALRALHELIGSGGWRQLPGAPNAVIHMRPWPDGSVDTLAVFDETDALVERTNARGEPVWRQTGTVADVIAALGELPGPFASNAPREPLGTPDRDRDMGAS